MKTLFKFLTVIFLITSEISFAQNPNPCPNGGLENNNPMGWNFFFGKYDPNSSVKQEIDYPVTKNNMRAGVPYRAGGRTTVVSTFNTPPTDWLGGYPLAINGNRAIRIGDYIPQNHSNPQTIPFFQTAQTASYTFQVNNLFDPLTNRCVLKFNYAISCDLSPVANQGSPAETVKQEARFDWFINFGGANMLNPVVPNTSMSMTASNNNPNFKSGTGTNPPIVWMKYLGWNCMEYDLTAYQGMVMTINFTTSNCSAGGHYMVAYVDGLCEGTKVVPSFTLNANRFCLNSNSPILVDATATSGEESWFVEIQEADAQGNIIPGSIQANQWFTYQQATQIDLRNWYVNVKKQKFKPNTYYKIKVAGSNPCDLWKESSKWIYIESPVVDAGLDKVACCNNSSIAIGDFNNSPIAGYTYSWTSTPAGFTKNTMTAMVNPTTSTTYHLTVRTPNGCVATDDVDVLLISNINPVIQYGLPTTCTTGNCNPLDVQVQPTSCDYKLFVTIPDLSCNGQLDQASLMYWKSKYEAQTTYLWSTGETTPSIFPKPNVFFYTVTVTNGCSSKTVSITIPSISTLPAGYFQQPISEIDVNNSYFLNSTTVNFVVKDIGADAKPIGTGPAYHAYRFKLVITCIDPASPNYGQVICIDKCSPTGFKNGDISWNGSYGNGSYVRWGTFKWELTMWNCSTPITGQSSFTGRQVVQVCDQYQWKINWKVLGVQFHSGKYCSHYASVYGPPVTFTGGIIVVGQPPKY